MGFIKDYNIIITLSRTEEDTKKVKEKIDECVRQCRKINLVCSSYDYDEINKYIFEKGYKVLVRLHKAEPQIYLNGSIENDVYFIPKNLAVAKKICNSINIEQLEVVYTNNTDLLIEADAGTGKTTTIIDMFIEEALSKDLDLSKVIFLTFTKKSTQHTEANLKKALNNIWLISGNKKIKRIIDRFNEIRIETIDSFFANILGQLGGEKYKLSSEVKITDSTNKINEIIDKTIWEYLSSDNGFFYNKGVYHPNLYKMIKNLFKSSYYSYSEVLELTIGTDEDDIEAKKIKEIMYLCADKINEMMKEKMEKESVVFLSELSYLVSKVLADGNSVQNIFQGIERIYLDECQDCSRKQVDIFNRISEIAEHLTITAVGDRKQCIYGFRGSDSTSIDDLIDGSIRKKLSTNYRTAVAPLKLTNRIIFGDEYCPEGLKWKNNAINGFAECIEVDFDSQIKNFDKSTLKNIILREVGELDSARNRQGFKLQREQNKICILTRDNSQAAQIYKALKLDLDVMGTKVKVGLARPEGLISTSAYKDLIALLNLINNKGNAVCMRMFIESEFFNVYKDNNLLRYTHDELKYLTIESLKKILGQVLYIIENTNREGVGDLNYLVSVIRNLLNPGMDDMYLKNLEKILNIIFLSECSTLEDIKKYIEVNGRTRLENEKSAEDEEDNYDIIIMTVHASKGAEFFSVIYIADNDIRPKLNNKGIRDNKVIAFSVFDNDFKVETSNYKDLFEKMSELYILEENNLIYVALTRCIERVTVLYRDKENNIGAKFKIWQSEGND